MARVAPEDRRRLAVVDFESLMHQEGDARLGYPSLDEIVAELGGRDLACWCPLDGPCHADVLLDLANPGREPGGTGA